ncbi:MAG: DUF6516 family protein [Thermodesulfobacteriota bacterium]
MTEIQALLAETPFLVSTSLYYEERPPVAGLVKGSLLFAEGSHLDFKEFIITHPTLQIIKYAYHYRKENLLIFRYDNANDPVAKNLSTYPSHKHVSEGIFPAAKPTLRQVLQEIASQMKVV